jgi:DNA-binding XRE family transcriptional regulator
MGVTAMRKEKKARLERAGWKVGSVSDFLGLSAAEEALVELRLTLSRGLRERRTRRRLSQHQLAKLLGSSQSRVAKMESGDPSVSIDLLIRSLLVMGATQKELATVIGHGSR